MAKPKLPVADPAGGPPEQTTAVDVAGQDPSDLFGEGSFLEFDPEVGGIINTAMRDDWGHDQVKAALQQTNAFKEVSDRRAALADPATGGQARQDLAHQVSAMLGRNPNDPVARDMTDRLAQGAATWASLQTMADPGQLGTPASRVQEIGAMYGLPIGPDNAAQYTSMTEDQVAQELGQLSDQLYPYKPPGVPWQRFAGIFADIHRAEIGRQVGTNDPVLEQQIAQAQGNPAMFRMLLRQTPAWEDSPTGQKLFAERADQLAHDLSFGSAASDQMQLQGGQFDVQTQVASNAGMQTVGVTTGADSPLVGGELNVPASAGAAGLISAASRYLGYNYVWGGESVEEGGFDCSGLIWAAARAQGINLPRTAAQQQAATTYIGGLSQARPGDLLYWGTPAHHTAIYLGNGRMLAAPHRGAQVQIQSVYGNPEVHRLFG